ncbi:MAG: aldehyde ferredoxin oxidoreductase C-terminal domain-containing protein [Syntrophomonas sp.]|nr:aldehyde ferredoxin oxidoreductase C-terminal domain-containing protein [Syntrophomonas sp.]
MIRVNMGSLLVTCEKAPEQYQLLGGRALTSHIIATEIDPQCHPLGPYNKLVFAPGLLTGTTVPCNGRLSVGAKSPLTSGIKESNVGGNVSRALARLGIKGIVIEGLPKNSEWFVLIINKDRVYLSHAQHLTGLGTYDTCEQLRKSYGNSIKILSIGQAGEMGMSAASIAATNQEGIPSRHAGRGGLGAVMGSKKLKAIVIDDSDSNQRLLDIANSKEFNQISRAWAKRLVETKKSLTKFGTAQLVDVASAIGALPTRNFSRGNFAGAENINGIALERMTKERGGKTGHACSPGCVIRCSNIYFDKNGEYLTSGLEYETIALFGPNLEIDNLDPVAKLDRLCDDYGVDTIDVAHAVGILMEAGYIRFGDADKAVEVVAEIGKGSPLGRIIGQGAAITGRVFGVTRVHTVKGQALAGYDPRALKGTGVTYATSPMGADHTAGNVLPGRGGVDPHDQSGQVMASRDIQIAATVLDSLGLCNFVGPLPDEMVIISELLTAALDRPVSVEDVLEIGRQILKEEIDFNQRAGFDLIDNRLPEHMKIEKLGPDELVYDVPDEELDKIFDF